MKAERIGSLIGAFIRLGVGLVILNHAYHYAKNSDIAMTIFFTGVGIGWLNAPVIKI